jgi:LysR family transcriptional regulator, glycine cleavage system transcriptional activator
MNPRRLTPSMSWLVAFESAAQHLSFTRAANELSLTQSAVSRHVQALEQLLEVSLFRRDGRRIELTEAGAMYLREVRGGLRRIRNASLQVIAYRNESASIHLATLPTFAAKWLMPRLTSFYAGHPEVLVHVHSRIGQFDLELAGMNAAIGVGDGNWPGLDSYHLMDERMIPVFSPKLADAHPLNKPSDALKHTLLPVAVRPAVWNRWFSTYDLPAKKLRLGPQFDHTSHLIQAAVAGMGIALVPDFLVEDELRDGTLQALSEAPLTTGWSYYLFAPPHKTLPPALAAFKDWLLEVAKSSRSSQTSPSDELDLTPAKPRNAKRVTR